MTDRLAQPQNVTVWFSTSTGTATLGVFLRTRPTIAEQPAAEPSAPAA
jgi:hypothetical protein